MNSSAKLTALSLVSCVALGAAAFMGCSVSSTTSNDTDGGPNINSPGDDDDASTDTTDAGTDGGDTTNACPGNTKQKTALGSATCQTCLATKCCTQLTTCFDIVPPTPEDGGAQTVDCNDYQSCDDTCRTQHTGDDNAIEQCLTDICDLTAAPGIGGSTGAFNGILTCAGTNCATECQ